MKKTTQLKQMIMSPELEFIMEAHNGISAKIVEEAGFKGIWGSGLSISGSLGVRDNNEASWTQVLETVEFMSDATSIPILLDGDTGYGNFNNMRRLVKKLEQREVAGVCIEDKIFPKTNSFLRGDKQPLAEIDEFCGKIKAGKDTQKDDDFVIVARVEAFIAGWGLKEAIARAEAYRLAGADAVLIHSKLSDSSEIFAFMQEWADRSPVVIVPTKYYTTPTSDFRNNHISLAIWANHLFRGAVSKMQEIAGQIYQDQHLMNVEDKVVPVKEIFRLQDDKEIAEAEKRYLKNRGKDTPNAIILAATQGKALGDLTSNLPKTMLKIGKISILENIINNLNHFEIKDISVVGGYKHEKIDLPNLNLAINEKYADSGQMVSLSKVKDKLSGSVILLFGDILFKRHIIQFALDDNADVVLIVDSDVQKKSGNSDFVLATTPDKRSVFGEEAFVKKVEFGAYESKYQGEWIGVMKLSARGSEMTRSYIEAHLNDQEFKQMNLNDLVNHFVAEGIKIKIQYINGHWIDVNNISDLGQATQF
jgi:phosphoenolpyruvate phosphomutase